VDTDFDHVSDYGYSLTIQTDGKILVAGAAHTGNTTKSGLAWIPTVLVMPNTVGCPGVGNYGNSQQFGIGVGRCGMAV